MIPSWLALLWVGFVVGVLVGQIIEARSAEKRRQR